jgi:glycosyltransferase involved in cell wall biosynthesis
MKILVDARFYGLENAGLGRYTINLIAQLQKSDIQNQYVILLRKKYYDELNFPGNFEKILCDIKHYSLEEQIKLPKIINKINPDFTHFLHFNIPINFNKKFVVTVHDMTMHFQKMESSNLFLPKYFIKHFFYKRVFRHAVMKSQKIIVPSEFVKDQISDYFKISKEKVIVTYEGISELSSPAKFKNPRTSWPDLLNFASVHKEIPLYFLYVGNAYPHKNLERAIRAFVLLCKTSTQKTQFLIVSKKNVFTNKLEKIIEKLNAQEYVKILGFVEDEKLTELYKNSVGFVYPSLSEGFGLPGLEAMKAGTVLVCSDIPVFREIYGNHAIYFKPTEVNSIISALKKALSLSKVEGDKMIKNNKEFIKRYSWEKMARETLDVYNSVNKN